MMRYYDPVRGRYLTSDPIGFAGGDLNLYRYVGNNPIRWVDPWGLSGTLTIHSDPMGGGSLDGHSWISYKSDSTGETTTYGTWGNNPLGLGNGLHENLEKGKTGGVSRSSHLDDAAEANLMKEVKRYRNMGEGGWGYLSPCSAFVSDAWEAGIGENLSDRNWLGISNPAHLADSIIRANGGQNTGTATINKDDSCSSRKSMNSR